MASRSSNRAAVPEAKSALDKFKYEVANELGVPLSDGYNGDLTSKQLKCSIVSGREVPFYESDRRKCEKTSSQDARGDGYEADNGQDQGDAVQYDRSRHV